MKKIKAAFIDHSFHKKTKATDFIIKLLKQEYELDLFWDKSWISGHKISSDLLNKKKYQIIFFFQKLPDVNYLKKLHCQNFVWFPMYDGEEGKYFFSYLPYQNFNLKVITFCQKLFETIKKSGLECHYYQYQPLLQKKTKNYQSIRIFFWLRTSAISWDLIKKLISNNEIKQVILKIDPDPGQTIKRPSKQDIKKYNIKIINGWLSKKKHYQLLTSCNIFIASRKFEGIGLSFLEAMSLGMGVIAPNKPTMNEYISQGKNGFLYDVSRPQGLDLANLDKIGINTAKTALKKYFFWQKNKANLLRDLKKPRKKGNIIKICYYKILYYCYSLLRA